MERLFTSPARLLGVLSCMALAGFAASLLGDVYRTAGLPDLSGGSGYDLYINDACGLPADAFADSPEGEVCLCGVSVFEETYRDETYYSYVFSDTVTVFGFASVQDAQAIGFAVQVPPGETECAVGQTYSDACGYVTGDTVTVTDACGEPLVLTVAEVFPDDGNGLTMLTTAETAERMNGADGFTTAYVHTDSRAQAASFLSYARQAFPDADAAFLDDTPTPALWLYLVLVCCILAAVPVSGLLTRRLYELAAIPFGSLGGAVLYQGMRPWLLWQMAVYGMAERAAAGNVTGGLPLLGCLVAAAAAMAAGGIVLLVIRLLRLSVKQAGRGSLLISMGLVAVTSAGCLLGAGLSERRLYPDIRADVTVEGLQGTPTDYAFLRDLEEVRSLAFGYEHSDTVELDGERYEVWLYPRSDDMEEIPEMSGMDGLCIDRGLGRALHVTPGDRVHITLRADSAFPIERTMTVLRYADTPAKCKGGGMVVSPALYRELYGEADGSILLEAAVRPEALAAVLRERLGEDIQLRTAAQLRQERRSAVRWYLPAGAVLMICIAVHLLRDRNKRTSTAITDKEDDL